MMFPETSSIPKTEKKENRRFIRAMGISPVRLFFKRSGKYAMSIDEIAERIAVFDGDLAPLPRFLVTRYTEDHYEVYSDVFYDFKAGIDNGETRYKLVCIDLWYERLRKHWNL